MAGDEVRDEEIAELLNAIKQRVRSRYPSTSAAVDSSQREAGRVALPDLMPLVHARDAAQAKVAAIGSVNPRAGGPVNRLIQAGKRLIARSLAWFVRDQVTFNRQLMTCMDTTLEALTEVRSSMAILAAHFEGESRARDFQIHWAEWRDRWEKTLAANELQFLRSLADLQTGFSYRSTLMESNLREAIKVQHGEYLNALDRSALDVQQRLWAEMEKVRLEYERLIHNELRVARQRMLAAVQRDVASPAPAETAAPQLDFDYARFADRFRGSEEYVRSNQRFYLDRFRAAGRVLDLGCGRGEFLELLRENAIAGRGIESSEESVSYCRAKGLDVEKADLFDYLETLPEASEDIIFCSQVVEHLDPARLASLVRLCASRLRKGGLLAIETPNPECLAIFATHFYLDPTHTRPVPPALLSFHFEENGMGAIEVHRFAPAAESFPEIQSLPSEIVSRFFGGMDYAIIGRKLN